MIKQKITGFTLVEMAIALVIIGLLATAFLTPLSAQLELNKNTEARKNLAEIKEALLGFAVINARLPCPDSNNDGLEDACANSNASARTEGNVPWATLGTDQLDPWSRRYRYQMNNAFGVEFQLTTSGVANGQIRVCTTASCANTEAVNVPIVLFSLGQNGGLAPTNLDELQNINGDKDFVSHEFTNVAGGFDDHLVWISTNVLMNKMVSVGKLP